MAGNVRPQRASDLSLHKQGTTGGEGARQYAPDIVAVKAVDEDVPAKVEEVDGRRRHRHRLLVVARSPPERLGPPPLTGARVHGAPPPTGRSGRSGVLGARRTARGMGRMGNGFWLDLGGSSTSTKSSSPSRSAFSRVFFRIDISGWCISVFVWLPLVDDFFLLTILHFVTDWKLVYPILCLWMDAGSSDFLLRCCSRAGASVLEFDRVSNGNGFASVKVLWRSKKLLISDGAASNSGDVVICLPSLWRLLQWCRRRRIDAGFLHRLPCNLILSYE
jgi:hypothetical protein